MVTVTLSKAAQIPATVWVETWATAVTSASPNVRVFAPDPKVTVSVPPEAK